MTMPARIFKPWSEEHLALWGRVPQRLDHNLHECPLFSTGALARLIDNYPREFRSLVHMGQEGETRSWREGEFDGMSGSEVIAAIAQGRLWLNLRCVNEVDAGYAGLMEQMFAGIGDHVAEADQYLWRSMGILISSPGAQVYYHCDLPNQSLWQIAGRKRVHVYPPGEPFVRGEDLERIAVYEVEIDLPYAGWYDKYAAVYDLEPGQMLHWPLNSPHRVVNYDSLNIAVTTEYWSRDCRRRHRVNVANGALRHLFGLTPRSRMTSGLGYMAKGLLVRGLSGTRWLRASRKVMKPIEFRLNKSKPGELVELLPRRT